MNTLVNILLFEFVFVSSFYFYLQKRTSFLDDRYLLLLTLTRERTVLKNPLIPNEYLKYENIQALYYRTVVIGLLIFIVLGNITILEFGWFLMIQRFFYNCGFVYGVCMFVFCVYFQFELGFSLKEINEEENDDKIMNSVIRKKKIQGNLIMDIAYSMIFALLIILISCRFFITEGVFVKTNIYENLFSKYL